MSQENAHSNVRSLARESFRKRFATLKEVSDADFAEAVYAAVSALGVGEDLFRAEFGLSKDAVERWMQGNNLPQPEVRGKIIGWVLSRD